MTHYRALLLVLSGFLANEAIGQECPSSIDQVESVRESVEGWQSPSTTTVRLLAGLEIIEGDPNRTPPWIVTPLEDGKYVFYWKFRGHVGTRALWMRCLYENSEVRLVRRLASEVWECRVTRARSTVRNGRWIFTALCR